MIGLSGSGKSMANSNRVRRIIAFVGMPLSGKSTASKVAQELGFTTIVMGDVIRKEVTSRSLSLNDINAGKVASELREKEGPDAIAKRCIPSIIDKEGIVIIDGIRSIDEVKYFKEEFGDDFILIHIKSSLQKRFERGIKRKRLDDSTTIEELKKRDKRELSWNMGKAIEIADHTVVNESSHKKFTNEIKNLLSKLSKYVVVEIRTDINPTEDPEKVKDAIKNLFPDAIFNNLNSNGMNQDEVQELVAYARDISTFRQILRKQRILDTARKEFFINLRENRISVYINKQIATVSKVNFTEYDSTLSPLLVTFNLYNITPERFIDYLAPQTKDGKPIKELDEL